MSDDDIRRLYNRARAVIVPLKDVYQPSGYSVTLQAMSCGRPVVLTKTRGLWAPEHFIDGENCLLVPPGDAAALGAAISRLRSDASARRAHWPCRAGNRHQAFRARQDRAGHARARPPRPVAVGRTHRKAGGLE